MSLTDEQLRQIRERAEAATPGPWYFNAYDHALWSGEGVVDDLTGAPDDVIIGNAGSVIREDDRAFVAHAREDIPALLDHIADLQQSYDIYRRTAEKRVDTLLNKDRALREVVVALANEATYSSQSGEGSAAYLTRLIERARAVLRETR